MKTRFAFVLVALTATAACAGGTATDGPAPAGHPPLAYTMPRADAGTFVQADTVRVEVDAGGQVFRVTQSQSSTLAMSFRTVAEGLEVTSVFTEFDARIDNPMAGPQRFTTDAIQGPLVFTLDRRGRATLVAEPEIGAGAQALMNAPSMAETLFPRLPDRPVSAGETWTDTIAFDAEPQGGRIRVHSVVEYTVWGDTVVAGRPLLRVDYASDDTRTAEVSEAGMDIVQDMSGTGRGHFLWDRELNRLHSQVETGTFTGTMEVPGAPFPLGLSVTSVSRFAPAGG
jgi:hypothetical protein